MEIGIFSLTVVVYLLVIFKACQGDRWSGSRKDGRQKSAWLDRCFDKVKQLSVVNKISFNCFVVLMAVFIVIEACVLIRINFARLENKHVSYHVDTYEVSDQY